MGEIVAKLRQHYERTFSEHGATSQGVDWGPDEKKLKTRYDKILAVTQHGSAPEGGRPSFLDVGCGFGGLVAHAQMRFVEGDFTGIDLSHSMISWAQAHFQDSRFVVGDFMEAEFTGDFDYVVCNGILTQKLDVPSLDMDKYSNMLIKKMFSLCRLGVSFNIMSTKVNFFSNNLYYRNPAELLAWCQSEVTPMARLDHSYNPYEYAVYLYR